MTAYVDRTAQRSGLGRLLYTELVRRLHDASEGYVAPARPRQPGRPEPVLPDGQAPIVAQRDVTPQNTVFRNDEAWGLIDFDLCDWTTRSLDLANTATHWVPLGDPLASTAQHQPLPGDHLALPQALVLWSQKIEPFGGTMGGLDRPVLEREAKEPSRDQRPAEQAGKG